MPQGSILAPILFIMYVNDMHTVSSLMKCIIFADDTNLLYTGNDISEICKTVSKELDKLSSWFMANIAKNVSVMNRVKHLLNSHALYSLYTTLIISYMNYCCEFWGNNYKSRIHPLYMLQKKLYESVNMRVTYPTQGPFFTISSTLCVFMIWLNI